ncbi:hypothetical protein GmHk_19G055397 [Glycine max]|nr:hypothetical protein GmHk_19G055397 [Glycine max]
MDYFVPELRSHRRRRTTTALGRVEHRTRSHAAALHRRRRFRLRKARGCSSSEDSDDEVYLQNASDEDELGSSSGSMPKLQFRNMKSKGCWNEEMGMGEVIEKNGKMWVTTGIVRSGKIYSSIEETL